MRKQAAPPASSARVSRLTATADSSSSAASTSSSSSTGGAYQYYNEKTTADTWAKANRQFPTVSGTGYLTYGKPVLSYGKSTGWDIRPDYYSRNGKVNFPFRF